MSHDTKNFKLSEFACKCCGENHIDQRVIELAQKLRDELNVPVLVTSGYRCKEHNARVGGVPGSYHTFGLAADLACKKGARVMFQAVQRMWKDGVLPELRYCIYYGRKNIIHVDLGKKRKNVFEVRE